MTPPFNPKNPANKTVSKTDMVAQKAMTLSAEEIQLLEGYKNEFHKFVSAEAVAGKKNDREFIYGGRKPLIECQNIAREEDLVDLIVANRQPLQAINYSEYSHPRALIAQKDNFKVKANNFEGVCLGAVFYFFEEAKKIGATEASLKFKEGMPLEAHRY